MKYFANTLVNGGTRIQHDITDTNKKKLASYISQFARSECFLNNEYSWRVWNEYNIIVAAGSGRRTENGFCYYSCEHLIGEHI
jgi:hypothetical protein